MYKSHTRINYKGQYSNRPVTANTPVTPIGTIDNYAIRPIRLFELYIYYILYYYSVKENNYKLIQLYLYYNYYCMYTLKPWSLCKAFDNYVKDII